MVTDQSMTDGQEKIISVENPLMSRPVRIEFPGAIYHISSKNSKGQLSFRDRNDRAVFINILDNVVSRFGWMLHSYVLMDEHYHLVIEIPEKNLSRGMRQLNGVYTQHFNRRHHLEGPIFQGRFKSILFEKDRYLLPVCRHVVLNPLRLGASPDLSGYVWSSYRATAGLTRKPDYLHTDDVLAAFDKHQQRLEYQRYVEQGIDSKSPFLSRSNQVLLGSPEFLKEMQPVLHGEKMARRGPKQARRRRSLTVLFRNVEAKSRQERNELIRKAHLDYAYTLVEIGNHIGLHYTTVSKVVNGFQRSG